MKNISARSLASIEGNWPGRVPAEEDSTPLVLRIYKLYHTIIGNYTTDDMRFMIGQHRGLKYLVPQALVLLKENILAEGNYYPGDLLKNVLTVPDEFWDQHSDLLIEMSEILFRNADIIDKLDLSAEADLNLHREYHSFLKKHSVKK